MKIGILACVYGVPDLAKKCLDPWFDLQKELNLVIGCCHSQFKEYAQLIPDEDSETLEILKSYQFDCFFHSKEPRLEHEVRDIVLQELLEEQVDYIVLLDGDEIWTQDQIHQLVETIKKNPFHDWFSIEYKNLIFDEKTYGLGFCPPRIFKTKTTSGNKLYRFYWDNDLEYEDETGLISYRLLAGKPIKNILPLHYTWLNNERSRLKIEYQNLHFGPGGCSFAWSKEKGLIFNEDFYAKTGTAKPNLLTRTDI